MPGFVTEGNFPGAARLTPGELRAVAQKSSDVLRKMGPRIQWVESYVADDNIDCVHVASDEGAVREHAREGGLPIDRVARVVSVIGPAAAE